MAIKKSKAPVVTGTISADRKAVAERVMKEINSQFAKGKGVSEITIGFLGNMSSEVERVSSGSYVLDEITGGGLPVGRVIEIYGPESSGKTSIALNAIANVQREGGVAAFIDAEQALDPHYARILGVNTNDLLLAQVSVAEEIFKISSDLIKAKAVDLIVIDSVAAMVPKAEFDEPEKNQVALLARMMSKQLRILSALAAQSGCTIIFLNQIREKVGVMFGNPETTPGGKALKFFASQRIEVRRKSVVKDGDRTIGTEVRMKIIKNKVAAPFQEGVTVLTFAKGINRAAEALVIGEEMGFLKKSGRTYSYIPTKEFKATDYTVENGVIKLASSKADAITAIEQDKALFEDMTKQIASILKARREGLEVAGIVPDADDDKEPTDEDFLEVEGVDYGIDEE